MAPIGKKNRTGVSEHLGPCLDKEGNSVQGKCLPCCMWGRHRLGDMGDMGHRRDTRWDMGHEEYMGETTWGRHGMVSWDMGHEGHMGETQNTGKT